MMTTSDDQVTCQGILVKISHTEQRAPQRFT